MKNYFTTILLFSICFNLSSAKEIIQDEYYMNYDADYMNNTVILIDKFKNDKNLISELNILQGDPVECYEAADSLASSLNFITGGTMSYEDEYNLFYRLYDVCMQGASEY